MLARDAMRTHMDITGPLPMAQLERILHRIAHMICRVNVALYQLGDVCFA